MLKLLSLATVICLAYGSIEDNRVPKGRVPIADIIMIRGSNGQLSSLSDRMDSADVCEECKTVVEKIDEMLHTAEKLDEFKMMLKMLCDYLGGDEKEECKVMVDNIDALIHKLEPWLKNPQALCKELGLCGEATSELPRYLKMALVHMNHAMRSNRNDMLCDECKFVMSELKSIMEQEGTKDEAKEALEEACNSILSGSSAQECVNIVDQYFPMLYDELLSLIGDGQGICVDLSMCQSIHKRPMKLTRLLPAIHRVNHHQDNHVLEDIDDFALF